MGDDDAIRREHWLPQWEPVITKARVRRKDVVVEQGSGEGYQLRSLNCPLALYWSRGQITGKQRRAGEKLYKLWVVDVSSPYVQVRYRETMGGAPEMVFIPPGFGAIEYRAAMQAIRGDKPRALAQGVCCEGFPASHCLRFPSKRTGERKGMEYLRSALDDMAEHFGFDAE